MEKNIDHNPELEGAEEALDLNDTDNNETEDSSVSNTNSDPLDAIQDPVAREEAKKHRAIARRLEKEKGDDKISAPTPSNIATKDDLKTLVMADAKKMVSPAVAEVWDELKAIPLSGFDSMNAESVATNMIERYNIYLSRNPSPDNSVNDLSVSLRIPMSKGGNTQSNQKKSAELPGYREPIKPDQWYPE